MKKLLLLLVSLLFGTGVAFGKSEIINVDFEELEISISSRVCIYPGNKAGMRLLTDDVTKKYIALKVNNGKLIVKPVPGYENYLKGKDVKIYVASPKDSLKINTGRNYSIQKNKSGNHVKK